MSFERSTAGKPWTQDLRKVCLAIADVVFLYLPQDFPHFNTWKEVIIIIEGLRVLFRFKVVDFRVGAWFTRQSFAEWCFFASLEPT